MKTWKYIDWAECDNCGDAVEILTEVENGYVQDEDAARCMACGTTGMVSVNDDGTAYIQWHEEEPKP